MPEPVALVTITSVLGIISTAISSAAAGWELYQKVKPTTTTAETPLLVRLAAEPPVLGEPLPGTMRGVYDTLTLAAPLVTALVRRDLKDFAIKCIGIAGLIGLLTIATLSIAAQTAALRAFPTTIEWSVFVLVPIVAFSITWMSFQWRYRDLTGPLMRALPAAVATNAASLSHVLNTVLREHQAALANVGVKSLSTSERHFLEVYQHLQTALRTAELAYLRTRSATGLRAIRTNFRHYFASERIEVIIALINDQHLTSPPMDPASWRTWKLKQQSTIESAWADAGLRPEPAPRNEFWEQDFVTIYRTHGQAGLADEVFLSIPE